MRTTIAVLAAVLLYMISGQPAQARESGNGFFLGSKLFGSSDARRKRVKRVRARRKALLRKRRAALRRRATSRRSAERRSVRRTVRARRARKQSRRKRTARRTKVSRRRVSTATRRSKVRNRKASNLYKRQTVRYRSGQKPGTIVVDTKTRHLYYVLNGSKAIRYGVAVGKEGFAWSGTSRIRRKVEWPTWTPPREMIKRKPELAKFAGGMPGGADNPLGSRALYLFKGKRDTLYRIHGTNNPGSIGRAASSGCIRMKNADVAHLYARVRMGAKVIVR